METATPRYTCPRCHYNTDIKSHYVRHLKKQTICQSLYSDQSIDQLLSILDKEYKCTRCDKSFAQIQGLSRHKKVHANEPSITINNNTDSHDTNNIDNSHNIITIENINVTVNIMPFGKEDMSLIQNDPEFLNRCIRQGVDKAIPEVVKQIFLNDELPQNQNVKLGKEFFPSEMKVYRADIRTGVPVWGREPRSQVIQELVDKGANVLQAHNAQVLNAAPDEDVEAKENYDRRNTKLIDVKARKRGTGKIREAVLTKFREHHDANTASTSAS